ncbi:MAG: 3-hydroxyacyl-CoA dehydrogenase NAD-binding domain-containing protein [Bacteroidia bacterium]|nr:3-hydroxyacyl-CoA dehydrogenase NAD-binding domain-containing protein [Bacteroidia bacterium]|tara:strand:- start:5122 stop:6015 length:894 start_codon:yes stop_codon:yes gene_type:complete
MKNISVIGSGTMGNGIAHVFAQNGYLVSLVDINENALEKALITISKNLDRMIAKEKITASVKEDTLNNIQTFSSLELGVKHADLVVEAATENKELKFKIFKDMDVHAPKQCILASNTSSISITELASQTQRPDKVIGMHFMNPVPVMKLVEIINGYSTSNQVTTSVEDLSKSIGKIPAMANDYPGFIANRILMPMINEAIWTLHEGVGDVQNIDTVMKLGMAHPMGPLQLADFIGLDVCLAILEVLYDGFGNPKYAACPLLVNMVNAGKMGVKSGEGFYSWTHGTKELVVSSSFISS